MMVTSLSTLNYLKYARNVHIYFWLCIVTLSFWLPPNSAQADIVSTGNSILRLQSQISIKEIRIKWARDNFDEELQKKYNKALAKLNKLSEEMRELLEEKEQTKKELKQGFYCSQCRNSKSQIERATGKSFSQHLKDVRGRSLPMSSNEIKKIMEKYDKKIAALQQKIDKHIINYNKSAKEQAITFRETRRKSRLELKDMMKTLQALKKQFKQEQEEYVTTTEQNDKRWYAQWAKRRATLEAQRSLSEKQINRKLRVKQAEMNAAMAEQVDPEYVERIGKSIQSLIAKRKTTSERFSDKREDLILGYGKAALERIKSRREHEERINDVIIRVGIGETMQSSYDIPLALGLIPGSPDPNDLSNAQILSEEELNFYNDSNLSQTIDYKVNRYKVSQSRLLQAKEKLQALNNALSRRRQEANRKLRELFDKYAPKFPERHEDPYFTNDKIYDDEFEPPPFYEKWIERIKEYRRKLQDPDVQDLINGEPGKIIDRKLDKELELDKKEESRCC